MMNIHRLTSTNLPSIRIHEHQSSYDSIYDDASSAQRSLPRDIPFKSSSSPTAIRSYHGGADVPPPLLPIHPIHPVSNQGHSEWDHRRGDGRDRHSKPSPVDVWGSESSGRGYMGSQESLKGGWSIKRQEDGFDREARSGLERLHITERQSGSLQSEESRRKELGVGATMSASMTAYDRGLLQKLSPIPLRNGRSQPSPIDDGPFSLETDSIRRPQAGFASNSAPVSISPRPSASPLSWNSSSNSRPNALTSRMAFSPEQNPPVFPLPMDFRAPSSDQLSTSSYGGYGDSFGERLKRHASGSLGKASFEDFRERLPLRQRKSFEPSVDENQDMHMEDIPSTQLSKMKQLNIRSETPPRPNSYPVQGNSSQRAGSKRRASSPPIENRNMAQNESNRKLNYDSGNEAPARRSPVGPHPAMRYSPSNGPHKFHTSTPGHNSSLPRSVSSFSSVSTGWSNSLGSSLTSAASSFNNHDRNSPVPSFSPSSDVETLNDSPYLSHSSLTNSHARRTNRPHHTPEPPVVTKQEPDTTPQKLPQTPVAPGTFMCECCPKKPKKFATRMELQVHEMEKQYTCSYCNNRFKNKNEAERHQNSLHLRKHSWSCAALAGHKAAFHQSSQRGSLADVCGYCGKEFPHPANWTLRIEHLQTEHKFGECNQSKKFFRADHFRQHLKHSHSGTAGKWTNVLENACMRDEPAVDGNGAPIGRASSAISEE